MSDQIAFDVVISDFVITIPASDDILQVDGNRANFHDFLRRLTFSNDEQNKLYGGQTFDVDLDAQRDYLELAFSKSFHLYFDEVLSLAANIDSHSRSDPKSTFKTKLIEKSKIIFLMKHLTDETLSDAQCELILAGLSITPASVAASDISYFNPQRDSRALKRCFFEITFNGKPHLIWVPELVMKAVDAIPKDVSFGKFPPEWLCTKEIKLAVEKAKMARGEWFEEQVARVAKVMGINGLHSKTSIGKNKAAIKVTPGELDFIGWSDNDSAIILLEDKMLKWAAEPKHVKNQNSQFYSGDNFVAKMDKKVQWIEDNLDAVVEALKSEGIAVKNPTSVRAAFITFEPLFANYHVKEYPVVSLAEFDRDFKAEKRWPYAKGIRNLP